MSVNPLPARLHPDVQDFLQNKNEAQRIVETFGSPTHVVFPNLVAKNISRLQKVLTHHDQADAAIFFATKVNKAKAFLEEAAHSDIGIDVSSMQKLQTALSHGVSGNQISISDLAKNKTLQTLGIRVGNTFAIDDTGEFRQIIAISRELQPENKIPATIRLNGGSTTFTRFGVGDEALPEVLDVLSEQGCPVHLHGFSFHLSGYSPDARIAALKHTIEVLKQARLKGLTCNTINIGGGFAVQYVEEKDWGRFQTDILAEKYVDGIDLSTSFVEGMGVFGPVQYTYPTGSIYDYRLKSTSNHQVGVKNPKDLLEQWRDRVLGLNKHIAEFLDLNGYGRADFRLDTQTQELAFLEMNVQVCFHTDGAFILSVMNNSHYSYTDVVSHIVDYADEHRRRISRVGKC